MFVFEFKSYAEKTNDQKMRERLGRVGGFYTSVLKSPVDQYCLGSSEKKNSSLFTVYVVICGPTWPLGCDE